MKRSRFLNFRILILVLVCICASINSTGQIKPIKEIKYANENCYSRSIKIFQNHAITGNSNGKIYSINLKNKKIKCLTVGLNLAEIRDIEISNGCIFGLQSADSGAVIRVQLKRDPIIYEGDSLGWSQRFLDGMAFQNKIGFIMGDPVDDKCSLFLSIDGGSSWSSCPSELVFLEGEAGFAASGTNVQILSDSSIFFVSGGLKSRFFKSNDLGINWTISEIPYPSANSAGAYSLCMIDNVNGVIVGGDYTQPDQNNQICFYTNDGGQNWQPSEIQPLGYRSCVIEQNEFLFCCGTNGIDYSLDFGKTWIPFTKGNYFSMISYKGKLFATTTNGSFHIFELPKK
jgi:hypothetical protein